MLRMIPCQSSNLSGIAYEPGKTWFIVQFSNGSFYRYDIGQEADYWVTSILFAESQGKAFQDFKSEGFLYEKIEDPSLLEIHV